MNGTGLQTTQANGQQQAALATLPSGGEFVKLGMKEVKELASIFIDSGFFPDAKNANQAMVKILAGQELGFPAIVSMTGIHFFMNKVEFSSTLKASAIKASGKYDYKILDHTADRCEVAFFRRSGNEWASCGVPVVYTIQDAAQAKLMGKDNWKNHPKDMLFAACIRQGLRRHCADVLHGYAPETDIEITDEIDTRAIEDAAAQNVTVDGEIVDTATGEVIEPVAQPVAQPEAAEQPEPVEEPIDADESQRADLREAVLSAYNSTTGEARQRANKILGSKTIMQLDIAGLKVFLEAFSAM